MKKATKSPRKLAKAGVKFAKLEKSGALKPVESKKEATHEIKETANDSAIATPVKRGKKSFTDPESMATIRRPKPPVNGVRQDAPRIPDEKPDDTPAGSVAKPDIPNGATHLAYTSVGGTRIIFAPIAHAGDFEGMRGTLRFGKFTANDDFVSMMPGEEGMRTSWKDGITRHAIGTEPGSGAYAKPESRPANDSAPNTSEPSPATPKPPRPPMASRTASKPKPADQPGLIQNGVRKPAGGTTAKIWGFCDQLRAKLGRTPSKAEVAELTGPEGINPGTSGTQFSNWRRFNGLR